MSQAVLSLGGQFLDRQHQCHSVLTLVPYLKLDASIMPPLFPKGWRAVPLDVDFDVDASRYAWCDVDAAVGGTRFLRVPAGPGRP